MLVVRKKVSLTAFSSPAVDAVRIELLNNSRKYTFLVAVTSSSILIRLKHF